MSETSVKIIKNEVRCRDDTVPKTVDTRMHCKVGLRACNNLPQPPPYIFVFGGCGRLLHALNPIYLAVLSCIYSFWHGVIPTSYFIFTFEWGKKGQPLVDTGVICLLEVPVRSPPCQLFLFVQNKAY